MRRVISLFLPNWPIERRAPEAGPLVLARRSGNRRLVHAANAPAREAGLRPGMAVAQAQAMLPGLAVREADLPADAAGLERLGLWALRYSPLVAIEPPDGLVIDATGAAHLFGGELAMLRDMVDRLAAAGIFARAALAASRGAAYAFARAAAGAVTLGDAEALLALPVQLLRLPEDMPAQLCRLGLERIGDLAAAPRAPLTQRFGPLPALRLDQALGRLNEPIEPLRPPGLIEVSRQFAEPIAAPETLARHTGGLAQGLCEILQARCLGVRRLDLLFLRVDADLRAIRIGTARPNRDAARLTRLLCDKLETIDPGFGIETMILRASQAEPYETQRPSLLDAPEPDISGLLDSIANRVGGSRFYRLAPVESDVPERSVARLPAAAPAPAGTWPRLPRPIRLLRRPQPIQTLALLPDHPPLFFTWRGTRHRIRHADGPERVFGEWWKRDAEWDSVRDYFRVENEEGERYWIFRKGDGEHAETGPQTWFLHGVFG